MSYRSDKNSLESTVEAVKMAVDIFDSPRAGRPVPSKTPRGSKNSFSLGIFLSKEMKRKAQHSVSRPTFRALHNGVVFENDFFSNFATLAKGSVLPMNNRVCRDCIVL